MNRGEAPGAARDDQLGAALRELDVPEHRPDFFIALRTGLERSQDAWEETASSAANAPEIEAAPDRPAGAPADSTGVWGGGRDADEDEGRRRRVAREPAGPADTGSAGRAGHRTGSGGRRRGSGGRWWRLLLVPIPIAAAILILIWVVGVGPKSIGPQQVTAAEIQARVNDITTSVTSMRGTLVVVSYDTGNPDEMKWTFAATSNGDFRLSGVSRREELAYSAEEGRSVSISWEEDGVHGGDSTGLAAGLPDPAASDWVLNRELGSVVRAMLVANDARVAATEYEGRAVWTFDTDVQPNRVAGISGNHLSVTVDQATGFPVRAIETKDGAPLREVRIDNLELDPQLPADEFRLAFPEDAQVTGVDHGFRRVELPQVESITGYAPVLPVALPDGYELSEVTAAEVGEPSGKEGMNPPADGVVSVAYRRGFDRVVVSTRLVGGDPAVWSDPLSAGEGFIDEPERIILSGGMLDGAEAEVLIDPRGIPHVWAMNDQLLVTIAGDLSREELIKAAESFEVWSGQ